MAKFTVRAMKPGEIQKVGAGLVRAFELQDDAAHWMRHEWTVRYPQRPGVVPAMHRVGVLGDEVVAHALVEPWTLRYGGARLRVAGISKVYTDTDHRRQGYSAAVLRDALTYAIELGAHLVLLNGIPGYYSRFGFSPVFPDYAADFATDEIAQLPTPLTVREARPGDIPTMAALFERHWGGRVTFTRSPETWIWRVTRGDDARRALVICGEDDVPQGYIAGRDLLLPEVEVIADTPEAALTLFSTCGQWAQTAGLTQVRWLLPPDDALVAFAQQTVSINLSAHYEPDGGWMARLVDSQGLIDALLPELLEQGRVTLPDLTPDKLILICRAEGVEIGLRHDRSTFSYLSQRDFIQVLFGSLSPATLGLRSHLSLPAIRLLQALFPPRMAALGGWDWF
ncbi:MAG TPA: GNAT family N-acetyltransferase [Phototrophicaceae bacterium]|jgi:predicted N-acetyltransferase YhbS|nr:GNAT family N-acetyltransferase [Phototrophicaceae bacterium]